MRADGSATWETRFSALKLPGILTLAVVLRLVAIQTRGLQYDDVFSIFLSQRSLGEIIQGTAADTMPPLYYFLLHFWMLVSRQPAFIRLLSIIFSVLAVFLVYLIGKRLFGKPAAEWAALLTAISPFQYYHAQDVRNYALLLCCQLGYLYSWVLIWQTEEQNEHTPWPAWVGLVVTGTLGMYTHNVAIFGLIVPDVYWLLRRKWKSLGRLMAAQAVIALLALPWLLMLPGQIAKIQRAWWQPPPGFIEILQVPLVWTAGLPLPGVWLVVGLFISIETLALLIVGVIKAGGVNKGAALLISFILVLPAVMFAASYLVKPIFVPRGFILASAAFYGLAGWAVAKNWRAGLGKMLAAGFVMAAVIGIPAQITFDGFPRSPFESAAADLAQRWSSGSVVIHDNKLSYFPFRFYQPGLEQHFIADPAGSGNDTFAYGSQQAMQIFPDDDLAQAVGSATNVYFVVFSRAIQEYNDLGVSGHPSIYWLQSHFDEKNHWIYHDLEVFQFEKP